MVRVWRVILSREATKGSLSIRGFYGRGAKAILRSLRSHQDDALPFYFRVALYAIVAPAAGNANATTIAAILSFIGFTFAAAGTAKYITP